MYEVSNSEVLKTIISDVMHIEDPNQAETMYSLFVYLLLAA